MWTGTDDRRVLQPGPGPEPGPGPGAGAGPGPGCGAETDLHDMDPMMEREADKEARRKIQFSVPSSVPTQLDPKQVEMVSDVCLSVHIIHVETHI